MSDPTAHTGPPAHADAAAQPAQPAHEGHHGPPPPKHYRRPLGAPLCEWVLLLSLLAAGALSFTAQRLDTSGSDPFAQIHAFLRVPLVGVLRRGHPMVVPWAWLLAALALVLVIQAVWPRLRPEIRGATVAYAFVLLLAPVVQYGPQVHLLSQDPEDLKVLTSDLAPQAVAALQPDTFQPLLPVTWPLLVAAVVLGIWVFTLSSDDRPSTATAFGLVTLVLCGGGWALMHFLLVARGNALQFRYTQWPTMIAALWMIGQLGTAATAAAAASRDALRSRLLAGLTCALLLGWVVVSRGKP